MDNLASLIDAGHITSEEAIEAESDYSRLAHECHRLRLENERMRRALDIVDATLDTLEREI